MTGSGFDAGKPFTNTAAVPTTGWPRKAVAVVGSAYLLLMTLSTAGASLGGALIVTV